MSEATEEKEPETYGEMFHRKVEEWRRSVLERKAARARADLLTKAERDQKHREVRRGILAEKAVRDEFWNEFFLPMLESKAALPPAKVGEYANLEAVALDHLLASGGANFKAAVLRELGDWVRVGEEAQRRLAEDDAKRKRLAELTGA